MIGLCDANVVLLRLAGSDLLGSGAGVLSESRALNLVLAANRWRNRTGSRPFMANPFMASPFLSSPFMFSLD